MFWVSLPLNPKRFRFGFFVAQITAPPALTTNNLVGEHGLGFANTPRTANCHFDIFNLQFNLLFAIIDCTINSNLAEANMFEYKDAMVDERYIEGRLNLLAKEGWRPIYIILTGSFFRIILEREIK